MLHVVATDGNEAHLQTDRLLAGNAIQLGYAADRLRTRVVGDSLSSI